MKNVLLSLMLLCSVSQLSAQFGVRAGVNLAKINSNNFENKLGFQAGVFYDSQVSGKMDLRVSALYTQKGFNIKDFDFGSGSARFNNLDIGTDLIFTAFNSGSFSIKPYVGPYLGLGLNAFIEIEEIRDNFDYEEDDLARLYFGLNLGVNLDFNGAFIGVNYGLGLSKLINNNESSSVLNRVLSIVAGHKF